MEIQQTQAQQTEQRKDMPASCLLLAVFVVCVPVFVIFPYLNVHELLIC